MEKENMLSELEKYIKEEKFIKIVFSDKKNGNFSKIIIKPLSLKTGKNIQIESFKDNKAFHKNIELNNLQEIENTLKEYIENFKQILLQIENLDISFMKKKERFIKKENKNNLIKNSNEHNKKKQYILNEGDKIDFLIELGLMSAEGKILKSSYSKFKQINKYLEFIDDVIEELKSKKLIDNHINILDFGCGKSYLTFALYYYLKHYRKDLSFSIVGLDLKKDVIEFCNKLAQKLNYENLEFLNGNIKDYDRTLEVDLVFSLHACNNATYYSLEKALSLNSKAILAVPCCHHEFFEKIQKNKNSKFYDNLKIMADNGIALDKFASLATDSFRSLALELCGYKTKMIEFIDMEHTPKNILIKAIKSKSSNLKEKLIEYSKLKEFLGIQPLLEELTRKYFLIDTNIEIPYN
ncbi:class I SAM-dependent methyltransferase [Fusobacterium hwasookii]|uniref:Methyltransferase n=1 Tax=Fusobacterium hwasookii ChDC F128 TaxID=1216362 RepID=A0ABP2R8V5_9FUSO|nr:SAM-dependent methyltransferase [Fusobacterium hwasookii]EJU08524.1 methyltransferase [Fusobacterium hwasookii ChDC F128]QNE67191.1 SAM-dependent methyltransferase [Fusobacterium hwasookii]